MDTQNTKPYNSDKELDDELCAWYEIDSLLCVSVALLIIPLDFVE